MICSTTPFFQKFPHQSRPSIGVLLSECFGLIEHCICHQPPTTSELHQLSERILLLPQQGIEELKNSVYTTANNRVSAIEQKGQECARAIPLKKRYLLLSALHIALACAGVAMGIGMRSCLAISLALITIATATFVALQLLTVVLTFELTFNDDLRQREIDLAKSESIKTNEYGMAILVAIIETEMRIKESHLDHLANQIKQVTMLNHHLALKLRALNNQTADSSTTFYKNCVMSFPILNPIQEKVGA